MASLRIIQGGQTGVDRGAWRGAVECGLARGGWMPNDMRDEHGMIPDAVRMDLRPALNGGGNRARTLMNVDDADAVLIVVVDATRGCVTPGTRLTWRQAGVKQRSRLIVDDSEAMRARCTTWMRDLSRWWAVHIDNPLRPMNLMIAGPRASLWPEGEEAARQSFERLRRRVVASPSTPRDHDADEFDAGRDLVEERAMADGLEILTVYRARRLASGDLTFAVVVRLERADIVAKVGEWRTEVRATKSWNSDTVIMVDPDESPPHTSSPGSQFAAAKLRFASLLGELDDAAARLPRDGQRKLWDALLTDVGERLVETAGEP